MRTNGTFAAIAVALLVFAVVILLSCAPAVNPVPADIEMSSQPEAPATAGPPPLVVNTSAPLLLEEPSETREDLSVAASGAGKENTTCLVCHANYRAEFLANRHAKAGIGCANCHGDSVAHKNDENNTTPPETMYLADKINPFCQGCHTAHDVSPGKIVARWFERGLDKSEAEKAVCTHCHGEHRMKVRTVIWDKNSGELLSTNKGR